MHCGDPSMIPDGENSEAEDITVSPAKAAAMFSNRVAFLEGRCNLTITGNL